ncbi:MAG: CoxG family protein [Chloroflexota bacterium]
MKLQGQYSFPAGREQVWALMLDPDSLKHCVPGCESLEPTGPDQYQVTLKVGVAAIRGTYKGKIGIVEKEEPVTYRLQVEGSGGPGFVRGEATIKLEEDGAGTKVIVDAEGNVGGTVAGVGQRMLGGVAKMLMDQFFNCLKARVGTGA